MFRSDDDSDDNSSSNGTADAARTRVRSYFAGLREQLNRQEVAALTVVDTHIRERLCAIRQQEEDIATILSQVRLTLSESFEKLKWYLQLFYCFLSVIICVKLPSLGSMKKLNQISIHNIFLRKIPSDRCCVHPLRARGEAGRRQTADPVARDQGHVGDGGSGAGTSGRAHQQSHRCINPNHLY